VKAFHFISSRRPRSRLAAAAAIAGLCCLVHDAQAEDARAQSRRLAERAAQLGQRPEGVLPLLELWNLWDQTDPRDLLQALQTLAQDKKLAPPRRVLVETLLAEGRTRLGDPDALGKRFEELGFVTRWRVIGPFDNEGKSGLDTETAPEQKRMEAPDLQASYPGRERAVSWRAYPDIVRRGYVSFGAVLRPRENVCGLAETFVHSDTVRPLSLWIGSGGANKVYWNGEEVFRDAAYRMPSADRAAIMVGARAGANRLLVKVCVTTSAWGFQLRLGDAQGGVAQGLRIETTSEKALDIARGNAALRLPPAPVAPLAALERAVERGKPTAEAVAALARYLRLTGSDDPAERRAKQLAARAVDMAPTLPHLKLAADLSEQRSELMRFASRAAALYPKQPESLLLQARVVATGPAPVEALPLLEAIPEGDESWPEAQLQKASILNELELPAAALRVIDQAIDKVGATPQLLRKLADVANTAGAQDRSVQTRERLLALRFDDTGSRRVLIADALVRHDKAAVLEHIEAMGKLAPGGVETLLYIAELYDALGRDDMVLATYRRGMELAPESPEIHVAYGRALLRAERPELAADAFFRALALKPQDTSTRELLEQIKPKQRDDEAYAMASDAVLALRGNGGGYPITVLTELTVKTVFDSGLGSSFHQHAAQVHSDEGARQYRTYGIQYDPDSQRVDVRLARVFRKDGSVLESVRTFEQQLGEPWYRIYYDTRALVVVFPDLEPGDVVELRYRVDDVAHRNLFADYFGDLHPLQGFSPVMRSEYVLITPAARKFYFNEPALAGLKHSSKVDGHRRIDHYLAEKLPAIVAETGMPGITEAGPYLHVSTYKGWEDVGRWYWGLIKDQLYADEQLKRTVLELTRDQKTTRDKVEAIHNWVVANTRYVGLEFGIHGYMPYRVPLIVQRGFGDCKDKASLMYTMLREAGIDARIVLVRTRRNGAIVDQPASLAVFDHAITYVPEFDLYLDGTAEHSGTSELPVEDQGVSVLVVGPRSAELRRTPVLDADRNKRTRSLRVALAADGSAKVEADEVVAGAEAAGYRDYYQAPGTRAERFERTLGGLYPGLKLEEQRFAPLSDLEEPVRYSYRIQVPQLARWDGDELRLEPSVLHDLVQDMARLPKRRHTLDLHGTRTYIEERSVRLPPGMLASDVPAGGEASSAFGRLKLDFKHDGGTVTARTEFAVTRDRVAPSEYPAFRRWVEAADQLLKQRIGIRKDQE
jgi:transglutaminase-like putative cysteine protease